MNELVDQSFDGIWSQFFGKQMDGKVSGGSITEYSVDQRKILIGEMKVIWIEFDNTILNVTVIIRVYAVYNFGHNHNKIPRMQNMRSIIAFYSHVSLIHIQNFYIVMPMCAMRQCCKICIEHKYIIRC